MRGASLSIFCIWAVNNNENRSEGSKSADSRAPDLSSRSMPSTTSVPSTMLFAGSVRLGIGLLPIESMKPSSNR